MLKRLLSAICIVSASWLSIEAHAERLADSGSLPVLAWGGPPPAHTDPQTYRELADCGFTDSFSGFADADSMEHALDIAHAAGVRLLISCPELKTDTHKTVERFKHHPALGGYFLQDEPSATEFGRLADWAKAIREKDAEHHVYINLFPSYATADQLGVGSYQAYVDQFARQVPASMISFDFYPVVGHAIRADWYQNLETISAAARTVHKPVWAFALSLRHYDYPTATQANLREQIYSDLAYGAQAIQYFTYWQPGIDGSGDSPIDFNGKRTVVYDRVKEMNAEIRGVAPIFLGSTVIGVGHTGIKVPAGTRAYQPASPVTELSTQGTGTIVSLLAKGNRRFLVVVNRDIERSMPLRVGFDASTPVKQVVKDGTIRPLDNRVATETIDPGDMRAFTWTTPGR
jgi:hypothetical protein